MLESGYTHIDTADVYGDSEELIGKWSVLQLAISSSQKTVSHVSTMF